MGIQGERCIGMIDSGVGGLTVAREFERLMPEESIVYCGDSANCPYGNRSKEEIMELTLAMLDFMREKNVKIAAVACNTISTLIDSYRERYEFPIVSIVEAACEYTAELELSELGIFATEFAISQGVYEKLMRRLSPETRVSGISSRKLAALVDAGHFDGPEIDAEIELLLRGLNKAAPTVKHVVLGCTHYPIVAERFEYSAPGITFINPALAQAKAVKSLLTERGMLAGGRQGHLNIFTSGDGRPYMAALEKLDIRRPVSVHTVDAI